MTKHRSELLALTVAILWSVSCAAPGVRPMSAASSDGVARHEHLHEPRTRGEARQQIARLVADIARYRRAMQPPAAVAADAASSEYRRSPDAAPPPTSAGRSSKAPARKASSAPPRARTSMTSCPLPCRHTRAICRAAKHICRLADYLREDDARTRCEQAREDCKQARDATKGQCDSCPRQDQDR
jgi:hypothetical protein